MMLEQNKMCLGFWILTFLSFLFHLCSYIIPTEDALIQNI